MTGVKTQLDLPACPRCGARDVVPVVYGLPAPEATAAEDRGELVLGGCLVGDEDAELVCRQCHAPLPRTRSARGTTPS
jgi:ribosomal protein L40E